jgi:hypothetical protein
MIEVILYMYESIVKPTKSFERVGEGEEFKKEKRTLIKVYINITMKILSTVNLC